MTQQTPTYSEQTLNRFAEKERDKAIGFLRKHFGLAQEDCEDIFQDAFIILLRNCHEGKLDNIRSTLSTYFIQICANKAHELLKARKRMPNEDTPFDELPPTQKAKAESLISLDPDISLVKAKEAITRQIVHDLPWPCDKLLWGFFRDNLPLKTIADMLGKTVGYVKVTKHNCQQKFRSRYNQLTKHLF